jgi:hypothetical protein
MALNPAEPLSTSVNNCFSASRPSMWSPLLPLSGVSPDEFEALPDGVLQHRVLLVLGRAALVLVPHAHAGVTHRFVQNFSAAQGDKLDRRKILAGAPLAHDLTNIDKFVRVLGYSKNDPGFGPGTKTSLEISGPHGTAIVNLEGAGKLELKDLLQHNSLLLPH